MTFDGAIKVEAAEPDGQFRLVNCRCCGGDNVAYVQYSAGRLKEPWKVRCFDCGYTVDKEAACKHDAQGHWNNEATHVRYHQERTAQPMQGLRVSVPGLLSTVHERGEAGLG